MSKPVGDIGHSDNHRSHHLHQCCDVACHVRTRAVACRRGVVPNGSDKDIIAQWRKFDRNELNRDRKTIDDFGEPWLQ